MRMPGASLVPQVVETNPFRGLDAFGLRTRRGASAQCAISKANERRQASPRRFIY
jgi:hypothetical protein